MGLISQLSGQTGWHSVGWVGEHGRLEKEMGVRVLRAGEEAGGFFFT